MTEYSLTKAAYTDIVSHLETCKNDFIPPLQETVNISNYARKIKAKSITFEAWQSHRLVGLIAAYFNDPESKSGFITNVSVERGFAGQGIASNLLSRTIKYAQENKFNEIRLKVHARNALAVALYRKHGFEQYGSEEDFDLYRVFINQQSIPTL